MAEHEQRNAKNAAVVHNPSKQGPIREDLSC